MPPVTGVVLVMEGAASNPLPLSEPDAGRGVGVDRVVADGVAGSAGPVDVDVPRPLLLAMMLAPPATPPTVLPAPAP